MRQLRETSTVGSRARPIATIAKEASRTAVGEDPAGGCWRDQGPSRNTIRVPRSPDAESRHLHGGADTPQEDNCLLYTSDAADDMQCVDH
eukprot:486846-Alexandrium_andersonii.AAC.1